MSESNLHLVSHIDSRIDIKSQDRRQYRVLQAGSDVSYIAIKPDGGVNNNSLNFTINPPSRSVFVNRRPVIYMKFRITFLGTSVNQTLLQCSGLSASPGISSGTARFDGPRCRPITQIIQNLMVTLNNDRISTNLNSYSKIFQRYNTNLSDEDINFSGSPSWPDQSQQFTDFSMTARSELGAYSDSYKNIGRGGFYGCTVTSNGTGGSTSATVEMECYEYLTISPFDQQAGEYNVGLYDIQNLSVNMGLSGKGNSSVSGLAACLWSHSNNANSTFTSISADVIDASVMMYYITPPNHVREMIHETNYYPYNELTIYPTSSQVAVVPGATVLMNMNNVQLNSIPERVYLWCSDLDSSFNWTTTDTFFNLLNVSISFDNRDSILSNASEFDLYQIAMKNNCNLSFTQYKKYVGSVLALDFGTDIPLRQASVVGSRGSYNLRISATFKNIATTNKTPSFNVLVISEGILTISNGVVSRNIGILAPNIDVTKLDLVPFIKKNDIYGGKINFKNIGNSINDYLKKSKILTKVGSTLNSELPEYLQPLGTKLLTKAQEKGYGLIGGGLIGGKKLTRRELLNQLQ